LRLPRPRLRLPRPQLRRPRLPWQAPTLNVLAAQSFLADIAQNVAGDRLKIEVLIPPGVDPHIFEPTPADVRKVADSDVLIVNGAGFEEFLAVCWKMPAASAWLSKRRKG
jgi:ABC-type Zn uptake system ZnuABC Zn-binding protein ZnuA